MGNYVTQEELDALYDYRASVAVPKVFFGKPFDAKDTVYRGLLEMAQWYVRDFTSKTQKGLWLHGNTPGSGKSHLAAFILEGVIRKGYIGVWWNLPRLLSEIRATFNAPREEQLATEACIMDEIVESHLLVIDDLGAERHKGTDDFASDVLYRIVNDRYEDTKPIIVTSNLSPREYAAKFKGDGMERIVSRFAGMSGGVYAFPTTDQRRNRYREAHP